MAAAPRPVADLDVTHLSQEAGKEQSWQIDRDRLTHWRCWDGEIVIYDDLSGDTMMLDVIMSRALLRLLEAPATHAELKEFLAKQFDLEVDRQLARYTTLLLEKFQRSGLIEPVSNRDPLAGRV